ncbi:protein FAM228A [Balaenoptera acutorostrata]|uniref:Protein FAM228A n=1 Tax=Balaenoptera acutorostrata TaxID=9767 RepID=A0A452CHY3_BALAC|nr:protein FAM228A [Balaenoptera acutorostrata]XP_028022614.2 protein FAM228A [Balaenoptera acutorostrata]
MDVFKERRKELLHKKWTENVAKPLQQRIMEKVISYKGLEKTKQENSEYFLKHTNKTEIIFGDFYDPEVYNPFYMTKKDSNYGKVTVPPFCDPLFRRHRELDEERRAVFQYKTGKRCTLKEFKELEKARQYARLPQLTFSLHRVVAKEQPKASARPVGSKTRSKCSPEKLVCAEEKYPPDKEKTTSDLSQTVLKGSFIPRSLARRVKSMKRRVCVDVLLRCCLDLLDPGRPGGEAESAIGQISHTSYRSTRSPRALCSLTLALRSSQS